ncbi:PRC-barrel domain-containing protein [Azospirillum doebereinerae]
MRTSILPLLCATVPLSADACVQRGDRLDVASVPPSPAHMLVGLSVLSEDGSRPVGTVHDVVVDANNQPAEIIVASGSPTSPVVHLVAVSPANMRCAPEQAAVALVDLTPEQFAALSPGGLRIA